MEIIKINQNFSFLDYGSQKQAKITLDREVARELCLNMFALRLQILNVIVIKFLNYEVILNIDPESLWSSYVNEDLKNSFKAKISLNHLEYLIVYLFNYQKNGTADSEHIDIDFECKLNSNNQLTLTFVANFFNEYSSEEIKRLLK